MRRACQLRRQLESDKTTGESQLNGNSAFTPVESQKEFNHQVLFEQSGQPQENHKEINRPKLVNCKKGSVERESDGSRGMSGSSDLKVVHQWG